MITERECIRAILLTPEREVLLLRIHSPESCDYFWWITPGGGIEAGEDAHGALRRELREEVGLVEFKLGPLVWRRQHTFNWGGKRICQRESYHIVEVERFEPRMSDPIEANVLDQFRWWSLVDLTHAGEKLTPLSLPDIVRRYLRRGAPQEPLEVEVLVD